MSRKKKNRLVEFEDIQVTAYAAEGKSLGHLPDGRIAFIEGAVPGDTVKLRLNRNKKSFVEGKAIAITIESPDRVQPFCPHFGTCGGCKWQMLPYEKQVQYKQQQVQDQLSRISGIRLPEFSPIIAAPPEGTRYYRNKLEFTFSATRYFTAQEIAAAPEGSLQPEPALGFHAPGLFDKVVPIHTCFLQPEPTNILLKVLREYSASRQLSYYNFRLQEGWLRNAIIRVARSGEVMLNIVFQHENETERIALLHHLLREIPGITTLLYTINGKVNDTLYDLPVHTFFGPGYIRETLEDFEFRISPKSFFQTNTFQAEKLYQVVREFAGMKGDEILYDLYCGTGSIGIFCSKNARMVIGIEAVADAVKDAQQNAQLNGLQHCQFFTGDVSAICNDDFFKAHGRPDVLITDPPRAGMHAQLVETLLRIRAPRLVYVSCNPATQARDLALLDEAYEVQALQPVDMFPHTQHIENVALLTLR
ncbi:MAG: 23S rRNA (uracil(1939)-C(5))-methyltransferase RlmD [Bacteroidetes bacterium]|nr:23S rRNA (uracil(1939)-C(5))-methyltransferase RlmD [Bacteroidota bacterium]